MFHFTSGCNECQKLLDDECPQHPIEMIADKSIPSFATLTLPASFVLTVAAEGGYSVVCKKLVKTRTRLGPLVGKRIEASAITNAAQDQMFKVTKPTLMRICKHNLYTLL